MPSGWFNVPHFRQEHEYSCVAACVRMVLAHYGDVRTEADLRTLLDTQPTGTPASNVMHISGPEFEVYLRPSTLLAPLRCQRATSCSQCRCVPRSRGRAMALPSQARTRLEPTTQDGLHRTATLFATLLAAGFL